MIKLVIAILGFALMSFTDSTKVGIASQYAKRFEGRKTATGEVFRHSKLTAASNFFKLGSMVRVTEKKTGKSVVVRINDRMAKSMARKGRVVDLTNRAANIIGGFDGLTRVLVELL